MFRNKVLHAMFGLLMLLESLVVLFFLHIDRLREIAESLVFDAMCPASQSLLPLLPTRTSGTLSCKYQNGVSVIVMALSAGRNNKDSPHVTRRPLSALISVLSNSTIHSGFPCSSPKIRERSHRQISCILNEEP